MVNSFVRLLPRVGQLAFAVALAASLASNAPAQAIGFGGATQLVDNVANQGSPTIITFNGQKYMYYVNHGNSTIYVDVGLTGNPQSTGIAVYTGAVTDVGAAVFNGGGGQIMLSYISPTQVPMTALSAGGVSFGSFSALNTSSSGFNSTFVPSIIATGNNGPYIYLVLVGNNNFVYLYESFNGTSFGYISNTQKTYSAVSRPTLASVNGSTYVAYVNGGTAKVAVIGPVTGPSVVPNTAWSNSNQNGAYASLAIVQYGSVVYAFGQQTASSQELQYIYGDVGSWSAPVLAGNQLRWTPSVTVDSALYLVYQDDSNTNISYRVN